MNAQQLFASLSMWTVRTWFLTACLLLIGSGCDGFIVPLCVFNRDSEECADMSSVDGPRTDSSSTSSNPPIGPLRKFEWRAKIDNTNNRKFVGIDKKEYAISLVNDTSVHFSAARFDLKNDDPGKRLDSVTCVGCPSTSEINFSMDRVFLTGEAERNFWLLRSGNWIRSFIFDRSGHLIPKDENFDNDTNRKSFFHPILNACLIPLKPSQGALSAIVRMNIGASQVENTISGKNPITAAMIGDIDSIGSKNGIEIVSFNGGFVASVLHFDQMNKRFSEDSLFASTLDGVIQEKKVADSDSVEAAYVDDLNKDGFPDFIFSLSGKIFSSSYMGRDSGSGQPVFQNWTDPIQVISSNEKVRSVMAIDLTKDGSPELIVETDQYVHFYLNTP